MKPKPGVLVAVFLLVVLPFISWLYLDKGLQLRLKGLNEMKIKEAAPLVSPPSLFSEDTLLGKVTIFIYGDSIHTDGQLKKIIETIYNQNDGTKEVKIRICQSGDLKSIGLPDYFEKGKFIAAVPCIEMDSFVSALTKVDSMYTGPGIINALVVDKKGFVRKAYNLNRKDDIKMLIRHTAILIPERRRIKPQLVRQKDEG
ncbi:MAG TPA: hypothetical protein PK076_03920 [Saprospiraceae bacterium]|nr:hypothetical protein [Saprospiraceae bacterium]HQW55244.1 hypothetical protein [Saprospiraceae bacterium]